MAEPQRRRSREELRALVVDAAYRLLDERGIRLEPSSITYQRVFDHLEATTGVITTRGSVHERIWPSQAAFQRDVLGRAIDKLHRPDEGATDRAVQEVLATADLESLAGRKQALRDLNRVGVAEEERQAWESVQARLVAAVSAVVSTLPHDERDDYADLVAAARANQMQRYDRNVELFAALATLSRTTVRPDLGLTHDEGVRMCARVVTTYFEGAFARNTYSDEPATIDIRCDDGTVETWSLTAWGAFKIVEWISVFED